MSAPLRVVQLSDTHFLTPGDEPEGGHGYDTSAAFDAVLADIDGRFGDTVDLVVVTGDIADHGRSDQYAVAVEAFHRLPAPVMVCPGNHDLDDPFKREFGVGPIMTPRVTSHGPWTFVYADTNAGVMTINADGMRVDPPGGARLHRDGTLGEHEALWLRAVIAGHDAEHVFVWLHHPPDSNVPLSNEPAYTSEWEAVVVDRPKLRGFGGGHTHVPSAYEFADRPVFVAPSLKNNFDLDAGTWLPPGYRSYEFHSDGRVDSEVHVIDGDERWPRRPFGRALRSLFMGQITFAELADIAARRRAVE